MKSEHVIVVGVSVSSGPGTVPYFEEAYARRCRRTFRGQYNAPQVQILAYTHITAAAPTDAPTATSTATAAAAAAANTTEGGAPVLHGRPQIGEEHLT